MKREVELIQVGSDEFSQLMDRTSKEFSSYHKCILYIKQIREGIRKKTFSGLLFVGKRILSTHSQQTKEN